MVEVARSQKIEMLRLLRNCLQSPFSQWNASLRKGVKQLHAGAQDGGLRPPNERKTFIEDCIAIYTHFHSPSRADTLTADFLDIFSVMVPIAFDSAWVQFTFATIFLEDYCMYSTFATVCSSPQPYQGVSVVQLD